MFRARLLIPTRARAGAKKSISAQRKNAIPMQSPLRRGREREREEERVSVSERKEKNETPEDEGVGRQDTFAGAGVRRTRHGDIRLRERGNKRNAFCGGGTRKRGCGGRRGRGRGAEGRGGGKGGRGDGLAQIPHENSTIAHLPPVDTEYSRGALTYRVRHI